MSAGSFTYAKYESNSGGIYRVRVQPETIELTINAVTNAVPAANIDREGTLRISNGKRAFGVTPRAVGLRFTNVTPPTEYTFGILRVCWFQRDTFDDIVNELEGTYLGAPVKVIAKYDEAVR